MLRFATRRSVTPFAGTHAPAGDVLDEHGLIGLRNIVGHVTRAASGSFSRGYATKRLGSTSSGTFLAPSHLFARFCGRSVTEVVFDVPDSAVSSGASS